jgi:hypothetical protein
MLRAVTLGGALVLLGVVAGAAVSNPQIPLSDVEVILAVGTIAIVSLAIGRWPERKTPDPDDEIDPGPDETPGP